MSFYSHAQIPRYKGQGKKKTSGQQSGAKVTRGRVRRRAAGRAYRQPPAGLPGGPVPLGLGLCFLLKYHFICL